MKLIYDGFLPMSNGRDIRQVDVPLIQVPTMTEVATGTVPARQTATARGISSGSTSLPGWPTWTAATA